MDMTDLLIGQIVQYQNHPALIVEAGIQTEAGPTVNLNVFTRHGLHLEHNVLVSVLRTDRAYIFPQPEYVRPDGIEEAQSVATDNPVPCSDATDAELGPVDLEPVPAPVPTPTRRRTVAKPAATR